MEEKNAEIFKKQSKEKCIENFKKYILKSISESSLKTPNFKREDLIFFGIKGELSSIYLRPIVYKIFLDILPTDKSIQQWVSITFTQRSLYSQLKSNHFNAKDEKDNENEDMIKMDLLRTFPEIQDFNKSKVINILYDVLYIYLKESEINYKQGMNEIISILFISLYPYYYPSGKIISKIDIINAINSFNNGNGKKIFAKKNIKSLSNLKQENKNNNNGLDILFNFFHDENYIEIDLYFLFTNLMKKGFYKFYQDDLLRKKCNDLIKNKLKIIDNELYNHCININLSYEIFLEKWILSFFDRYTSIENCLSLLDIIISQEFQVKKNEQFNLQIEDNICLAMIIKYRKELLKKNDEEFLIFCLCYPKIENIQEIIKLSNYISLKLQNKESDNICNKRISLRINPKKPKYWMYSNNRVKTKSNIENQNSDKNQSFIESKSLKKKIIKKTDEKDKEEEQVNNKSLRFFGTRSSVNIKKSLNLKKKENDGFKILNFGSLLNPQFEDDTSQGLFDMYYF